MTRAPIAGFASAAALASAVPSTALTSAATCAALVSVMTFAAPVARAQATFEPKLRVAWDRFYDYAEVVEILGRLHATFPDVTRLESIGKSVEGRDLPLLVIHDPRTGSEESKAAMWIDGNVHGNEVQGAEAALYLASLLLERRDLEPIRKLVEERVFYVLPMVNPDGRAWWFAEANTHSSSRSGLRPTDNDRDGLFDEDGPNDLDGDGDLALMRKRVPPGTGSYRLDPEDPRRMLPADPEKLGGDWELLGLEGIDDDGDGDVNEDGPGGYDMNRNWPSGWRPNHIQFGAGDYPLSLPETRAIADFLLAHPNVAAVQSFHNNGGMILRGPGYEGYGDYPRSDVSIYDRIGREGEAMLPFYRYMTIWKDLYPVYGGFVNWGYEGLGIFSFTNELWNEDQVYAEKGSGDRLDDDFRFDDRLLFGETLVAWHPYAHPVYGEIEIGGRRKMTSRVPPPFLIEEMLHRNASFCLYHAGTMPKVKMGAVQVEPLGDGVSSIRVEVENERLLPTRSALAAEKRMGRPDLLSLEGLEVLAGGIQRDRWRPETLEPAKHDPARLRIEEGIGSHAILRARFVVRGSGEARITYDAEKGGRATSTIRVD